MYVRLYVKIMLKKVHSDSNSYIYCFHSVSHCAEVSNITVQRIQ